MYHGWEARERKRKELCISLLHTYTWIFIDDCSVKRNEQSNNSEKKSETELKDLRSFYKLNRLREDEEEAAMHQRRNR